MLEFLSSSEADEKYVSSNSLKGKYLSIIGDSISTYQGWNNVDPIPGAAVYYPHGSIDNVDKTYWKKLVDRTDTDLEATLYFTTDTTFTMSLPATAKYSPLQPIMRPETSYVMSVVNGIVVIGTIA